MTKLSVKMTSCQVTLRVRPGNPKFLPNFLAIFSKLLVKSAKKFGKNFGFSGLTVMGYLTVWSFLLISFSPCTNVQLVEFELQYQKIEEGTCLIKLLTTNFQAIIILLSPWTFSVIIHIMILYK